MTAETLMLIGGVASFLLTLHWVRTRELREKYAVAWLAMATLLLLCGLFPQVIMSFANASHLSYPAMVLFVALAVDYIFSFGVSLSLSRQYRLNVRLTQEIAILEERVRRLETRVRSQESGVRSQGSGVRDQESASGNSTEY
jgi:hypothetical protein